MNTTKLVPIDYDARGLRLVSCRHCPSWWAEVVTGTDPVLVREWHDHDCPIALDLAPADDARAGTSDSIEQAIGTLMGLYGLSAEAATTALVLRASATAMAPADLAGRIVGLVSCVEVDESTRRQVSNLLDSIGAA